MKLGTDKIKTHGMQILMVDDDFVDRESVKRILNLQNSSHNIREAETVDQALDLLNSYTFDVILLDYKMPQKDGIDLLYELQEMGSRHKSAVIMMSTTDDESIILKCIEAGAQDFISKLAINQMTLKRAMLNAMIRFSLEKELRDSYAQIKHHAEIDHLTGLYNRYAFDKYLKKAVKTTRNAEASLTLMLLDLDHFKLVNDQFGHDAGDKLLAEFSQRIQAELGEQGIFARVGGDEFAVIIESIHSEVQAIDLALKIISCLAEPLSFDGRIETVAVSIGMASSSDDINNSTTLFKQADIAVYAAKRLGRNQYQMFTQSMEQEILEKVKIKRLLINAIDTGGFELFYQPIFTAEKNGNLIGFEALIRWHNDGVIIMPDQFIPIAEETKLIKRIGRWVIRQAIKQLSLWNRSNMNQMRMSINLSAVQLEDLKLLQWIIDCVEEFKVSYHNLEFELTETALLDNLQVKTDTLNEIAALGCTLALDDFGTGFSSLSHLKKFPINTVKIDKSMLPEQPDDLQALKLFKGLCSMIQALELTITAEGVEKEGDLSLCQTMGVNQIQGYLLGRPVNQAGIEQIYIK